MIRVSGIVDACTPEVLGLWAALRCERSKDRQVAHDRSTCRPKAAGVGLRPGDLEPALPPDAREGRRLLP